MQVAGEGKVSGSRLTEDRGEGPQAEAQVCTESQARLSVHSCQETGFERMHMCNVQHILV